MFVASQDAPYSAVELRSALLLAGLGIAADLMNYQHRGGATGSVAFIPFAAAVLLAPNAATIVLITFAVACVQLLDRRHWVKSIFNVAQMALSAALAIAVFRLTGGASLLELKGASILRWDLSLLAPAVAMMTTYLLCNTITVSVVVARAQRKAFWPVWKANTITTGPFYLLTTLITYYLAWLYANLGVAGAIGLVAPMLGIRQLYKTTSELTKVTEELLDLMVAAIEARDPYTSGHSERVARASRIIAKALGLSEVHVERIGVAALLHDVGKIDEAFAPILAKEGRLTPAEWEIMKRHPIRSAELVGVLSSLKDVVGPVRHHHENWDGTGYPDGLKGEEIPLASRIIMFADTLDAMTTDRPYRKALGMAEAGAEFRRFRGRQFDPTICDHVLSPAVWEELYASFEKPIVSVRGQRAS